MNPVKLNLGCFTDKREGYINVDSFASCNPDVVADLNKKLPFENNSADEILANDIVEHLDDPIKFLNECHRILNPCGILKIRVPHYKDPSAYSPQHKHFFSLRWFTKGLEQNFNELPQFKIVSATLAFTLTENKLLEFIPNIRPLLWERLFPVIGMRIVLEKKQ